MTTRYAIYYAPAPGDPLDRRAATWLGFDASEPSPVVTELGNTGLSTMASARRYGFHATIKAPMRLNNGRRRDDFLEAVSTFAKGTAPVEIGPLKVTNINGFLALVPVRQPPEISMFASSCVAHFEPFRAPLTEAEVNKRLEAGLSARQRELLEQYGYPYVMDEFRMHLTLTDRLLPAQNLALLELAHDWFAPVLRSPYTLDRLAVFHEETPGAGFSRLADFPLAAPASLS